MGGGGGEAKRGEGTAGKGSAGVSITAGWENSREVTIGEDTALRQMWLELKMYTE